MVHLIETAAADLRYAARVLRRSPAFDRRGAIVHETTPEYSHLAGLRLVTGRYLDSADVLSARHVAVINEAFVHRYLADEPVLGRCEAAVASRRWRGR